MSKHHQQQEKKVKLGYAYLTISAMDSSAKLQSKVFIFRLLHLHSPYPRQDLEVIHAYLSSHFQPWHWSEL